MGTETTATTMFVKLRPLLTLAGHIAFSFVAALASGFTLYAFLRPILGAGRYHQFAQTPSMSALSLLGVAVGGVKGYLRWPTASAFLVWVLPSIWIFHLLLAKGWTAMDGNWSDPLFFFGIGAAYSVGAVIAATVIRNAFRSSKSR